MRESEELYRETDSEEEAFENSKETEVEYNPALDEAQTEPGDMDPVEAEWQRLDGRPDGARMPRNKRLDGMGRQWWVLLIVSVLALLVYLIVVVLR